jgi:hypothetical protein
MNAVPGTPCTRDTPSLIARLLDNSAGALGVFTVIATLLAHREHWTICAVFILVTVVQIGRWPRKL